MENAGTRIVLRLRRVVREARPRVELKSAGGKPVSKQPIPRLTYLVDRTFEVEDRVTATRNNGREGVARQREMRRDLAPNVLPAPPGLSCAWVAMAAARAPRPPES